MDGQTPTTITVSRLIHAPPEAVYRAWLDPSIARKFLFATPEGEIVKAEIDPWVGGEFVMTDRRADGDVEHTGRFLKLEESRQIEFEFGIPADSPERTIVTVEIDPVDHGSQITLHHGLAPQWAEHADQTRHGWTTILDQLARAVKWSKVS